MPKLNGAQHPPVVPYIDVRARPEGSASLLLGGALQPAVGRGRPATRMGHWVADRGVCALRPCTPDRTPFCNELCTFGQLLALVMRCSRQGATMAQGQSGSCGICLGRDRSRRAAVRTTA